MNRRLVILIAAAFLLLAGAFILRGSTATSVFLWDLSREGQWLLPLITVAALIDSLNPCAFSILLLTIAFLFSIGRLRTNILAVGSFYILGLFLVYLLIGLGILQALHLFNTPNFMAKLGATLLIALGAINVIGEFFPRFPIHLRIPHSVHHRIASLMEHASLPAAFGMGALVGLCEFPCTGGPYLLVLGLLRDQATYLTGLGYLVLYNALFILPLVLILSIASNRGLLERVQAWQAERKETMRLGGGIAMILLGFLIFLL